MFPLRSIALALSLGAFLSASPSSAAVIRLGVVTTTEPGFAATTVTPVVSEMEKLRPQDVVHVVQIAEHDLLHDIERERPDLLICSAWCFLNVLSDIGAHPVATRKTDRAASAVASIGAALVVRSDRTDLRTLEDLRCKKAAATLPHSVDGYPAESAHDRPTPSGEEGMLSQPVDIDTKAPRDREHHDEVPIGGVGCPDEDRRTIRGGLGDELPLAERPEGAGEEASDHDLNSKARACAGLSGPMKARCETGVCGFQDREESTGTEDKTIPDE